MELQPTLASLWNLVVIWSFIPRPRESKRDETDQTKREDSRPERVRGAGKGERHSNHEAERGVKEDEPPIQAIGALAAR